MLFVAENCRILAQSADFAFVPTSDQRHHRFRCTNVTHCKSLSATVTAVDAVEAVAHVHYDTDRH